MCHLVAVCTFVLAFWSSIVRVASAVAWRLAEAVAGMPIGAEIVLRGDEQLFGTRGISFASVDGEPFHIELVADEVLEDFLARRMPAVDDSVHVTSPNLCEDGRFILNDPRVGLFHNQRISQQTALKVAQYLRRILVVPGFFKFPHPDAWDGSQWVSVSRLFNLSRLEHCYPNVIELGKLIELCGPDILDNHVTVPFTTMWMRSATKAPWINDTRPHLRWKAQDEDNTLLFQSEKTQSPYDLNLLNNFGCILARFLAAGFAGARTIRTHGLISNVTSLAGPVCFFPNNDILSTATDYLNSWNPHGASQPFQWLGLHLRLFKRSTNTSGGYLPAELAGMSEYLCNMGPEEFTVIVSNILDISFLGYRPTHTYIASNEANMDTLAQYVRAFPQPRTNAYSAKQYDEAITISESAEALSAVLVDAILNAWAPYFIGNACSTMSEYIYQLRILLGKPETTTLLVAGVQHEHLLREARAAVSQGRR